MNAPTRTSVIRIVRRGAAPADPLRDEAARVLAICNDCRRCLDNCAVFPAAATRNAFARGELDYLANLCHHCGACFQSCPYVPPHASGVNVPRTLAQLRTQTHADSAWPHALRKAMSDPERGALIAFAASALLLIALSFMPHGASAGFYAVVSHGAMILLFGVAFVCAAVALSVSGWRFARTIEIGRPSLAALALALRDALTLHYLDSHVHCRISGSGDQFKPPRRALHHLMFYGLVLCFAATCVAAVRHAAGLLAPYPLGSWPVQLGIAGGIGVVAGAAGLLGLKPRQDYRLIDPAQQPRDRALLALLLASAATGLALLTLRATVAMPAALLVHLACVLALVVTAPAGKFIHGPLRFIALTKFAQERRGG